MGVGEGTVSPQSKAMLCKSWAANSAGLPVWWSGLWWTWGPVPASLSACLSTRCVLLTLSSPNVNIQRCVCTWKTFSKASALQRCLIFLTRRESLQTRDTVCPALWVVGRHLEMKDGACWTNCQPEQLRIWSWREESWGGGAWQELSWWECPGLLANAWLKAKCLLWSRWWSASFSSALISCLECTALLYQSRGSTVLFGVVIWWLKVKRNVQSLEG